MVNAYFLIFFLDLMQLQLLQEAVLAIKIFPFLINLPNMHLMDPLVLAVI